MASFGQLTNAFLRASQETTIAFANLNFDFALVKYDAPEEYKELGEALSQRRKDTAEDGDVHVTARKLGALFHGIMPDVPNLILAYGRRAGEVAGKDKAVPKTAARQRVFADHMGADGTSICELFYGGHTRGQAGGYLSGVADSKAGRGCRDFGQGDAYHALAGVHAGADMGP